MEVGRWLMFEFNEIDIILMQMVHDDLVELSVDENGEFIFFCTEAQKEALERIQSEVDEEMGW